MEGKKYKQIRYFKKGFSKSEYIDSSLIIKNKRKIIIFLYFNN